MLLTLLTFAMSGVVSTVAGGTSTGNADGYGTSAAFNAVYGISVDCCGRIYISDFYNNLIRRILPNGNCPMSVTVCFICNCRTSPNICWQ